MSYETTEVRVDRLEALFGQFLTEMTLVNKQAEERNRAADQRVARLEHEMREFKNEMRQFKNEMLAFKDEMLAFKNEMLAFKNEMLAFKNEMREFKNEMLAFKNEMREFKNETLAFEREMSRFEKQMLKERRDLNKKWGDLANKMGTIIEDILAPNLHRLAIEHFRFPAIVDFMMRRRRTRPDNSAAANEFDTIVVGPTAVILGEAKSSPSSEHVDEFVGKGSVFFDFFPEYSGRRLILVFGSWSIPEDLITRLTSSGIYAMQMGEETMELVNAAELEQGKG